MDQPDEKPTEPQEPFLLHESSEAFLNGDPAGILERFRFRRDALDYGAMALAFAGGLLLLVHIVQYFRGEGGENVDAAVASLALSGLLMLGGAYYVLSRQSTAAARLRLIREGQVLDGAIVACGARSETTTERALGEVTRSYLVSVDYRFATPAGQDITDHDELDRPDLRHADLPEAGARVRILYLDDQTYTLL